MGRMPPRPGMPGQMGGGMPGQMGGGMPGQMGGGMPGGMGGQMGGIERKGAGAIPFSWRYGTTRTSNEYEPDGGRSSSMTCLGTARARAAASGVVHSTKPHPRSARILQLTTAPKSPK